MTDYDESEGVCYFYGYLKNVAEIAPGDGCCEGCPVDAEWSMTCLPGAPGFHDIFLDVAIRPGIDATGSCCPTLSVVGSSSASFPDEDLPLDCCGDPEVGTVTGTGAFASLAPSCVGEGSTIMGELVCYAPVTEPSLLTWFFGGESKLTVPTEAGRWFGIS